MAATTCIGRAAGRAGRRAAAAKGRWATQDLLLSAAALLLARRAAIALLGVC